MRVLVVIRKDYDRDEWASALNAAGLQWSEFPGLPRHFNVDGYSAANFPLQDHPAIEAIEDADKPIEPTAVQSITLDHLLENGSWAIARIIRRSAPWNVNHIKHPISTYFRCQRDGTGVDYYNFDTGVDIAHPVFGGRVANVYEFFPSGGLGDDHGHGTLTTGCAIGDDVGIARGALGFSFKIAGSSGFSSNTALTAAIGQALTHYAGRAGTNRPAVCSISYTFADSTVLAAIADLINAGVVVVGPAGNSMVDLSMIDAFPAEAPDAICAGGLGMADIPYFASVDGTNYGTPVEILGPAQSVRLARAAVNGGGYFTHRGTSLAAPFVAGVIACMLQGHSRLTGRSQVQAVKAALLARATSGKFRDAFSLSPLPDRILYLDPNQVAPESIPGLAGYVAAPTNTAAPVISGMVRSGQTLSTTGGTWYDGGSAITGYGYQWKADGVAIVGATSPTFALTNAQIGAQITVTVTASNSAGSTAVTSGTVGPVAEAVIPDPHFANVVLLLGFDGANGAKIATDASNSAHSFTFFGDAHVDTLQYKFGGGSLLSDGVNDFIRCAHSSDFIFDADFTVEAFFRTPNHPAGEVFEVVLAKYEAATAGRSWEMQVLPNTEKQVRALLSTSGSAADLTLTSATGIFTDNAWHHYCLERSGSTCRLYLNGGMVAKGTLAGPLFNNSTVPFQICSRYGAAQQLDGWLDEIRITKGLARYASDAGFSVPTEAYPRS